MSKIYERINACRVCGDTNLKDILNLGEQCVIDFPNVGEQVREIRAPLHLVICSNKPCSLLQLRHSVDPDLMYRQYWYRSGINQTMRDALKNVTDALGERVLFSAGDIVIDIGANDGTLLRSYSDPALIKVGFEPAKNLIELAKNGTSLIINDYFNAQAFLKNFRDKKAKAITSIAMFYDLERPNEFVADISRVLEKGGVWVNQMNYLGTMLEHNAFDNISHEHLEYYSLSSLDFLMERHGLEIFEVEQNDLNGGSIRAYIAHKGVFEISRNIKDLKETEKNMMDIDIYEAFSERLRKLKAEVSTFIKSEVELGKKIYAYGASTRGNTLMQYFGLDKTLIKAAAERNPKKWGKRMVGSDIPIISEQQARDDKPDYFLVLPWAFIDEFVSREQGYLEEGGKFIVPLPSLRVINS